MRTNILYKTLNTSSIDSHNSFNFIRLVCCLIVIYEHTLVLTDIQFINLNLRGIAVSIFFVLSGFWVTKSYISSVSVKNFFIKRCKRLLPLYYGVIIVTAAGFVFFTNLSIKDYFMNTGFFKYLFANAIFLNFLAPNLPGVFGGLPINGSLWTLKLEVGFYLLLPVIVHIYNRLNTVFKKNMFLLMLYFSSYIYIYIYMKKFYNLPPQLLHQLPAYMAYFISGMLYYFNWEFLRKHERKLFVVSLAVFGITWFIKFLLIEVLFPFALASFVMFLSVHLKIFNSIGADIDYSYSMYLLHYPIIRILDSLQYFSLKPVIAIIAVFSITFLIAFLIYRLKFFLLSLK
ncbi:acyltransferase family protein [Treponema pedis]|uniref:acyltransferase family protein n=1 Tax=Treponema pedis TaxID=409322 RepID=UPI003D2353D7